MSADRRTVSFFNSVQAGLLSYRVLTRGIREDNGVTKDYLQPAQDEDEQPPQPEPLDGLSDALADFPMPKRDRSFSVLSEPHFSQLIAGFAPKTIFSNTALQALQRYS